MVSATFKTYANEHGGRVSLLLLLFLLAIYQFYHAGFNAFAIVCLTPLLVIIAIAAFRYKMLLFWSLVTINYFLSWKNFPSLGLPPSLYNEVFEILLLMIALIDVKNSRFERCGNTMLFALLIWSTFCILEVLNNTCDIGIDVGAWYSSARMMAFQLIYAFLVFTIYISDQKRLVQYLIVWGAFALFAAFWTWKQVHLGLTDAESHFLQGPGRTTHLLQAGTLIRYFSIYNDAANFGIGIASTAVAFLIFGITAKIKKYKYFFLTVGGACAWAMFPSGTRTAIACLMAGFMAYIFLSKSYKLAIPFTILFTIFAFILIFTKIGDSNQQIRRMRSAFDKNDASANVRSINQAAMQKYMREAPWGIGMNVNYNNVPKNNKFAFMSTVPPDSEYVFIWIHTGVIGITVFLICMAIMLIGACWIVFFTLKSPSLRGIGAGLCCAFVSQQVGGYGNQVLMQFPNGLVFFGGLTIVYILPWIEKEWIEWESKELAIQEEKKRLKIEKKRASRV